MRRDDPLDLDDLGPRIDDVGSVNFGLNGNFGHGGRDAWPDPDATLLGTNRRPAPVFPLQVLGPFWAAWAAQAAKAAAAPVDYPACALLATVGATIANVRCPVAGAGWSEPPLLWLGLVGSPSSGKSPALESAFSLIRFAETQLASGFDHERREHETQVHAAEAHFKAWKADVEAAVKAGETPPIKPLAAEEPHPPVRPRIRVADATVEKLGVLSAALPRGLLLARDELAGWVSSFDRYGESGSDRAFYLEGYGGRSYRIDRMKNAERISIRHLSIGVLGTTQPDRLQVITGGADDGLASRVLWAWPEVSPDFTLAREHLDETPAQYAFGRLVDLALGADQEGEPEPIRVRLTVDAENVIEAFAREMAVVAEESIGAYAGAIGKARGHALRLATVLEYLWWCGDGGRPEPCEITQKAVIAACAVVGQYFVPMASRVYGDASLPASERAAMTLARYLRAHRSKSFNARNLGREAGGVLRDPDTMTSACALLIEAGLIRLQSRDPGRGRPAKNYDVHSIVFGRA